jgi:hypothetical protein
VIKHRKKGTPIFEPDWAEEHERVVKEFQDGGKARTECSRHELALQKAIKTHCPDPKDARDFMSAVLASNARHLRYSCPHSRVLWSEALSRAFVAAEPKGPIVTLTLISENFAGSTDQLGIEAGKLLILAKLVEIVFKDSGYSVLGHSEYAIFPKRIEGNGYASHAHAQLLVWGRGKQPLERLLDPIFKPLADGTHGCYGQEITRTPTHALSYAIKTSAYGYSAWPKASGGARHTSAELPQKGHFQFVQMASQITWPELCIAVGEGVKIRDRALQKLKVKFPLQSCRPTDKLPKKARSAPRKIQAFTAESKVPSTIQLEANALNADLRMQAAEAAEFYGEYDSHSKSAKAALYSFLASIYRFALCSHVRKQELEDIASSLELPFNARTDLFGFAIKIALHGKKDLNRQLVSDWSRSLRYLFRTGCSIHDAEEALASYGIKASARNAQMAAPEVASRTAREAWQKIRQAGTVLRIKTPLAAKLPGRAVLITGRNKSGTELRVRRVERADNPRIAQLLKEIAKELKKSG